MGRSARPGLVELLSLLTVLCRRIYRVAAGNCVICEVYYATLVLRTDIFKQNGPGRIIVPDRRDLRFEGDAERVGWWILAGVRWRVPASVRGIESHTGGQAGLLRAHRGFSEAARRLRGRTRRGFRPPERSGGPSQDGRADRPQQTRCGARTAPSQRCGGPPRLRRSPVRSCGVWAAGTASPDSTAFRAR